MDAFWADLRHSVRTLWKSPGFTTIAVLTLALGIGANTAIFSAVNAVLLRPLPFEEPNELVRVYSLHEGDLWTASPPDFVDWREMNRSFERMAAWYPQSTTFSGEDVAARRIPGARVSVSLLPTLGINPVLGRGFTSKESVPGQERVVLLSHGLWQSRFGGDPQAIGRSITLDGESHTVVGVMPAGFDFPGEAEFWVPLAFTQDDLATQRGAHYLAVLARLRPGVTVEDAAADMRAIAARLESEYRENNLGWSATAIGLTESIVGDVRPALLILLGAVGLVLLIACANVANLLLVRVFGRDRELAIKAALGAGRSRLLRGVLTEAVLLGLLGGAAGLMLAFWGIDLLTAMRPGDIPRLENVQVDGRVLAFTGLVSVLTGVIFGMIPALQSSLDARLGERLREGGRGASGERRVRRTRQGLAIAELGLAVMLTVGATLLLKSFVKLQSVDPGFETAGLLTFSVNLPDARYPEPQHARDFYADLLERTEALPGVRGADAVFGLPLSGFFYSISVYSIDGVEPDPEDEPSVQLRVVTPGYFRTMGMELVSGRPFRETDRAGAPTVAMVNESAARLLWPGSNPLGHEFLLGTRLGLGGERVGGRVVGVVADFKHFGPNADTRPEIYVVHDQFPEEGMSVVVRADVPPASLVDPIRERLASIDREVPLYGVATMEELLDRQIAQPRFYLLLLAVFAATALTLAAVGVYGVMAHSVAQRTREIGIRIALGARGREVMGMVLRQGLAVAAIGTFVGLLAALGAARLLSGLLYEVAPTDTATFIGVPVLLLAVALLSCWLPAHRATRIDPMHAIRYE